MMRPKKLGSDWPTLSETYERSWSARLPKDESQGLALTQVRVELEFQVGFQTTKGAGGGVKVWVVSLDAKADLHRSATNRVKFTLTPVRRGGAGSDTLIKDQGTR